MRCNLIRKFPRFPCSKKGFCGRGDKGTRAKLREEREKAGIRKGDCSSSGCGAINEVESFAELCRPLASTILGASSANMPRFNERYHVSASDGVIALSFFFLKPGGEDSFAIIRSQVDQHKRGVDKIEKMSFNSE